MLSYMAVLENSSHMIWRVGCGGVILFIVSVRVECVVYNVCFIFSVGCLVFFGGFLRVYTLCFLHSNTLL